jgi:aryl-alcohol dehydrogenase-like predicted oxidoreductase
LRLAISQGQIIVGDNFIMQLRRFGSTDIFISPLGLGTVKLGRNEGVKYPQSFVIPDDRSAADLIALAKELGINLIDTAPAYGNSEERLGRLLAGQRHDWIICTKVGEEFINGESHFDFSAQHTRHSIERSLRLLKTDFLDIVLVHSDGNDEQVINHSDVLATLQQCQQEGLIRAYGVSTKTIAGGLSAAAQTDGVMITYNPDYTDEAAVLEYCAQYGKGVLIKKAFASGHSQNPHAALQFVLKNAAVSSVIVGTIDPKHLRENIAAAQQIFPVD